jgi:hypothetical protein
LPKNHLDVPNWNSFFIRKEILYGIEASANYVCELCLQWGFLSLPQKTIRRLHPKLFIRKEILYGIEASANEIEAIANCVCEWFLHVYEILFILMLMLLDEEKLSLWNITHIDAYVSGWSELNFEILFILMLMFLDEANFIWDRGFSERYIWRL